MASGANSTMDLGDILIVDDEASNLKLLSELLVRAGYQVRPANHPQVAIDSALLKPPKLVLLDVKMPDMDGFEMCRRLKQDTRTRKVPVLFISALHDLQDKIRGFDAGGVDFISKPFNEQEVLARVQTHMKLRNMQLHMEELVERRTVELFQANEILAAKAAEEWALINAVNSSFFLMDNEGTIIVANESLGDLYSRTPDELVGKNVYKLLPTELAESRRVQVLHAIDSGEPHVFVDQRSKRFIENRIYPVKDGNGKVEGLAVMGIDITEKLEIQQRIAKSEDRFRSTFEQAAVGIVHASPEGSFLRINDKFCTIVGYTKEEMLSSNFKDITHPDDLFTDIDHVRRLVTGEVDSYSSEKRYIHKNGNIVWINLTVSLVSEKTGDPEYQVGVIEDISDRKQAEIEILNYQTRLKALAAEITSVEERERRTIAADLHDNVGQSLAIARIQLQSLEKAESDLERNVLTKDLSDILLQASKEIGSLMFELSPPTMNEIGLSAAIAEWLEEKVDKKHGLKTEFIDSCKSNQQPHLDDKTRGLLFRNTRELLTNVIKHAEAQYVRVEIVEEDNTLKVIVEDDGVGFDANIVENATLNHDSFGLFSVQERMNDLGGWCEITAAPGQGCRVVMAVSWTKQVA